MDFTAVLLLVTMYFIRPQDWVPGLTGLNIVKPIMILGLTGMMLARNRKSTSNAPWRLMSTPHEWIMVIYTAYIFVTAKELMRSIGELGPEVAAFFLTLHSLTSVRRMEDFLKWWRWSLVCVALMGVTTLMGMDLTGSQALTDASKGRLALNTWMLNNANSLGHTLVTLLPLLYFGVIKGRPVSRGLLAIPPAAMACWCLWSTQSKGAYLVGAVVLVFSMSLGRPWWLKMSILAIAMGAGGAALSVLPRMNEMSSLRSDEGVMGRLMAWDMARNVTRTTTTGEGYREFNASIKWEGRMVPKATHSAYVQVGGDLGVPGLVLYMSVLCCGLRTMLAFHGVSRELDRLRGALFSLLVGYMASGWMVNRSYHLEFYLMLGAIAAYQKLCVRATVTSPVTAAAALVPATSNLVKRTGQRRISGLTRHISKWRRYGLLDAGLAFASAQVVLGIWDYVLVRL